jgi:hypothetical protein
MKLGHAIELTCHRVAGIRVTFGVVGMIAGRLRSIIRYVAYEATCGNTRMGGRERIDIEHELAPEVSLGTAGE